ncbi:TonB-dependent receptor [Paraburkholderia phenoliruptrix]|uniref:TonB-dependent receptor n=1 Tax=Paraburkholderia phenoliruptrix TaxID=252970 RepID=UPI001C6F4F34|nr:TonB-dependent siderophore receptor [Paraburkholderia phenoliruptrix]MBW9105317.1 TonB-dependent siderophore receptor [Paraburkholderia phenoliruptrix]MBW9129962.1 TonB-dependent siderophore receptor [Paraburkholderia ginsengiterrae]
MPHRKHQQKNTRRTTLSRAVETLFVGLVAATALQAAQAQAQAETHDITTTDGTSATRTTRIGNTEAGTVCSGATASEPTALPTVVVSSKAAPGELPAPYAGGQVARGGSIGVLGTSNVMNQPFDTTNYTDELIRDTQARTIADVVVNNASVRAEQSAGGFGDVFQIRGFDVQATDVALNGLYGMVSAARVPVNLLERVEVLEGPGALMYGMGPGGSVGGAINIVTKRADDTPLTRLTALYQSKGQFGVAADIGRRFGDEGQFGIRFNGQIKDGQTGIAHGNQLQGDSAIGLDYRGKQFRWSFDAYNVSENTDELRSQIGLGTATAIPAVPSGYNNLYPGSKLKLRDTAVTTRAEYDINQYVTVYGAAGEHYGTSQQTFPYATDMTSAGTFNVYNGYYDQYTRTKTVDAGLRFHFDTFGVKHTLVTGITSLNQEIGYFYALGSTAVPSNLYTPSALLPVDSPRGDMQRSSQTRLNSQQVIDTMSFFNDRLLITGGFRRQTIGQDNYDPTTGARQSSIDQQAITPLAGIVVKPLSNVSIYGNFTSGLSNGGTAPAGTANAGQAFAPYKSNQYEAGVKADWGRVMTSAAIFQITQPNAVTDPTTNLYGYNGKTRVRGLELAAYGQVFRSLRLMASATFYDPKVSGTAGGAQDGNTAGGVPKFAFNLGADYDLPWVQGLSVNGRIIHTGAQYYDSSDTLRLPSWTRYDVGLRYATRIATKDVVLRANIENLFGSRYWIQQGTYLTNAAPRTVLLSAQFDF